MPYIPGMYKMRTIQPKDGHFNQGTDVSAAYLNLNTIFPRKDAAATILFHCYRSAASIRGRHLFEGSV